MADRFSSTLRGLSSGNLLEMTMGNKEEPKKEQSVSPRPPAPQPKPNEWSFKGAKSDITKETRTKGQ